MEKNNNREKKQKAMEKNNREKKHKATKTTVGGKKRKRITITNHDNDADKKRSWSDLPYELLELIKKAGLFFIDQVNFRLVCKSWSCIGRVPPLQQIPWLLVLDNINDEYSSNRRVRRQKKDSVDSCKLVDSKDKKTYTINANVVRDKLRITNFKDMKVHESKYGWLLISSHYSYRHNRLTLLLYSPFFREGYNFIELPVLNCDIDLATFTSNPLDDQDCRIITLRTNDSDNTVHINTYRRGQSSWNSLVFKCEYLQMKVVRWMYSEGIFYYVTRNGVVGKFDFVREEWNVFPSLPTTMPHRVKGLDYHMVKSDGELFLILKYNLGNTIFPNSWWYEAHHIYRLDLSLMIWEDLSCIGDRVLFIGNGYNSVLNALAMKFNIGEQKGISDKIYYSSNYELKYCSVHDFTHRDLNCGKPRRHNCTRHYGLIAKKRYCIRLFIDPPSC